MIAGHHANQSDLIGPMLKVAIITNNFSSFGGSEIVALEVANYFAEKGNEVVIRSELYSEIFSPYLHPGVRLSRNRVDISKYDVVWSQHGHFSFNTKNLEDIKEWKGVFISSHLASSTPAESYHYPFSAKYAGGLIFNSRAGKENLLKRYTPNGVACNFKNAAPKKFHVINPKRSKNLKELLIVSNHLPSEVSKAITILRQKGVNCKHIGRRGVAKLIEPDDIFGADAVLSIGKTVQYALVGGCPVYCYDHFGGPGWLNHDNIKNAEDRNFSGLCTSRKKSPSQIAKELIEGASEAHAFTLSRVVEFQKRYDLEGILDSFLNEIYEKNSKNYFNSQECIDQIDLMRGCITYFDGMWRDVYRREDIFKVINAFSTPWLLGLILKPWRAREWNAIRMQRRKYKREALHANPNRRLLK